jgi:uncharacterized protein YjiS (DUF1127 family)
MPITLQQASRPHSSLAARIQTAFKAYVVRRKRYRAERSLQALSDYMLKDMGITRLEIPTAVEGLLMNRERGHEDDAR